MRVRVKNWGKEYETDLEDYLTPVTGGYDSGGAVEQAHELANNAAKGLGKLLALLVLKNTLTFAEAQECASVYSDAELLP